MTTLIDTGPLVAAIDKSDAHYDQCTELLTSLTGRLLVPTTVIVEVCWMVEERPDIEAQFLDSVAVGEFEHVPVATGDLARTAELVRTYADFPIGVVDASVVALAERLNVTTVATLDRRHFPAVRPSHSEARTLLP